MVLEARAVGRCVQFADDPQARQRTDLSAPVQALAHAVINDG
jgi:hypothetical protein